MYGGRTHSREAGIRIVVGSSSPALRRHLRDVLDRDTTMTVVGEFDPWARALDSTVRGDLLVLGLPAGLPDELALQIHRIRGVGGHRVIAVIDCLDDDGVIAGLVRAGVLGIVAAGDDPELRRAVTVVANGLAYLNPTATVRVLSWLSELPDNAAVALVESLTSRQRDILWSVAQGYSNAQIAQRECISTATVKWHMNQILRKLGCTNRVAALRIAQAARVDSDHCWRPLQDRHDSRARTKVGE